MQQDTKPGEFKTSLMGFKKADVLAYVDDLAARTLQQQKQHEENAARLQKDLDALRADNDLLVEKTREVCDRLGDEEKRAEQAEARAKELAGQLLQIEKAADTYKSRLFSKEQEAVVLKADNQRLSELLATRQQELETARAAANEAETARRQAVQQTETQRQELEQKLAGETAALQAERLREAAELEAQRAEQARQLQAQKQNVQRQLELEKARLAEQARQEKQQLQTGAQHIEDTVLLLRSQLEEVDQKIAAASEQLQRATSAIYEALGETEQSLEQLGAQVERFPQPAPSAPKSPPEAERCRPIRPGSPRRRTLSDGLLDLLDRIAKEKQ